MSEVYRQKKSEGSRNTRKYPRYPVDLRVVGNVFRSGEVQSYWGRSTELGLDGIGATITGELQVGEVVSMEFALPLSAHPMKLRAIVRYRSGLHYGFEFLTVKEEQRNSLRRVCQMLAASGTAATTWHS
jgi:hypothetical protein